MDQIQIIDTVKQNLAEADELLSGLREISFEVFEKLVIAMMPMAVSIDVAEISKTPPYSQNRVADICKDLSSGDIVDILVCSHFVDDTGSFYQVKVSYNNNVIGEDTIRDWHLYHYVHKSTHLFKGDIGE